jgi:diguanylate cyclase (GGDEF)-like protein
MQKLSWRAPHWKRPFHSLPARITFFVFWATLLTSLTVMAISVRSIDTFLREEIDQKFPSVLASTLQGLDRWYDQRVREIGVFAGSQILVGNLSLVGPGSPAARAARARGEIEQYLGYVLGSFPQFDALFLLDSRGETLLWVGEEISLPEEARAAATQVGKGVALSGMLNLGGVQGQLASAAIEDTRGRPLGTLHALLHIEALDEILRHRDLGPEGEIFLVSPQGRTMTRTKSREPGQVFPRTLPNPQIETVVEDYEDQRGRHVVGSAANFSRFGWTLVVEEPYEEAFAPVVSGLRRILAINLAIVLVLGFAAFRITASIVRPIEALSDAAKRISEGEKDVVIPESRARDEVGVLTRAFSEMTMLLGNNARELEASRQELEEANRQLTSQNEELQRVNEILEQLSITDGLTRLHNHRFFQDHLAKEVKRADRTGEPMALILADIDHFKTWNDRLGHAAGDQILREVAVVMNGIIRETDLLARYGGEEFALLASNTDLPGAVQLAEKIRGAISQTPFLLSPPSEQNRVTVSLGVAVYRGDPSAFFDEADRALYAAKAAGRDCVRTSDDETSTQF